MKISAIAAVALLSFCRIPAALAHGDASWIMEDPKTRNCCGPDDCRRMADDEVIADRGGWTVVATGEHVVGITTKLRDSIDNHFWICRNYGPNGPGTGELRCLLVPKMRS